MFAVNLKKSGSLLKEKERKMFAGETKNQSVIRNYRGKLQWEGNLDEMRTDK